MMDIGYGVVTIPSGVENRDEWVDRCLRTHTVSILRQGSNIVTHNCYVTKEALEDIQFPTKPMGLGSKVVFVAQNVYNVPTVVGVVHSEDTYSIPDEGSWKRSKSSNSNSYSLFASLKDGVIGLINKAEEISRIILRSNSSDGEGEINLESNGIIRGESRIVELKAGETLKIYYQNKDKSSTITCEEDSISMDNGNCSVVISDSEVNINNGNLVVKK